MSVPYTVPQALDHARIAREARVQARADLIAEAKRTHAARQARIRQLVAKQGDIEAELGALTKADARTVRRARAEQQYSEWEASETRAQAQRIYDRLRHEPEAVCARRRVQLLENP